MENTRAVKVVKIHCLAILLVFLTGLSAGDAEADSAAEQAEAVRGLVNDWADAWQSGDFNQYAAYYAIDYRGQFSSREAWRESRRNRIEGRADLRIDLGPVLVQLNRNNDKIARATFLQSYRSSTWCDVVEKTLSLVRTEDGWRISGETSSLRQRC